MQIDVILSELCTSKLYTFPCRMYDLILTLQGYYVSANLHANDSASYITLQYHSSRYDSELLTVRYITSHLELPHMCIEDSHEAEYLVEQRCAPKSTLVDLACNAGDCNYSLVFHISLFPVSTVIPRLYFYFEAPCWSISSHVMWYMYM